MKFTYRWNNFTPAECWLPSAACTAMVSIVIKSGYQYYQRLTSYSWGWYSRWNEVRAKQRHPLRVLMSCNMRPGLVIFTLLHGVRDVTEIQDYEWCLKLLKQRFSSTEVKTEFLPSVTKISLLMLYVYQNNPCILWKSYSVWENFSVSNTAAAGIHINQYALRD
jgi:hypothetical protein